MILLSPEDWKRLKNSAKIAQTIENRWDRKFQEEIERVAQKNISPNATVEVPDFERMFIEHWFDTQIQALALAERETEIEKRAPRLMARPRTLSEIMRLYDQWRQGRFKPKAPLKHAKDMKNRYVSAVQKAWKKYSKPFREGGEQTQKEIRNKIVEAAKTTNSRAQTIVRTETTRYYNQARRDYYDAATDVTHYLFLAIRDKATTPWCRADYVNGKRGRSGLVYAKGDPLLKKECPPCHWNCRSELLPLNRFNPSHKKIIENASLMRRNHVCTPLPVGWN